MSTLEDLLHLRKQERTEEQEAHTRAMATRVEAALGPRVVEALAEAAVAEWEIRHTGAVRKFKFKGGEYHLALQAILGASRVEVELRHVDSRFAVFAKKGELEELTEDWFLNALEMLATQVSERLMNPRNFV